MVTIATTNGGANDENTKKSGKKQNLSHNPISKDIEE